MRATQPRSAERRRARRTGIAQTDLELTRSDYMGMGNLQRMAMQMQQEMERIQAELAEATVEGSAGGGVVRAVVTGKQSLVSITIDPSAVDPDDVDMLQDLVAVAVNEALEASRLLAEQKMGALSSLTGGLGGLLGR
jgi:nucleoid-associated protein EbfC